MQWMGIKYKMDDSEWFKYDGQLTDDERAFLAALRQRMEGPPRIRPWLRRAGWSFKNPPDEGALIVGLCVDAPGKALLTPGVHLEAGRIRGDQLDHQDFTLPEQPTSLALDVTGPPADLTGHTADWFHSILRRPIVRYDWLRSGQVYAARYLFADTGEGLSEMYNARLAPPGQREQLIAAGYGRGKDKSWIDTRGLGEPDRVIPIRGGA